MKDYMTTDFIPTTKLKSLTDVSKELLGEESEFKGEPFEVSLKLRGSPIAMYRKGTEVGIEGDVPIELVKEIGMLDKLAQYKLDIVFLATAVGPDYRGNIDKLNRNEIMVHDIYIPGEDIYLRPEERYRVCLSLGILHVPVFGFIPNNFKNEEELINLAKGHSINNPVRDGIVFTHSLGQYKFQVENPDKE